MRDEQSLIDSDGSMDGHHRRDVAQKILESSEVLPLMYDPLSVPVAGLAVFTRQVDGLPVTITPREIISEAHMPVVIYDLDDSIWKHAEYLVRGVGEASGVPISMEYFRSIGHTRKIPEWRDPKIAAIHEEIVGGNHPVYFPYVNRAWSTAVATVEAVDRMGHRFCYLTARPPALFDTTLRVMAWNRLAHDHEARPIDARLHDTPRQGYLYCAPEPKEAGEYKRTVVEQWLGALRNAGWKGTMVIIDDLLKPFSSLIASGEVVGISLEGDLNNHSSPYDRELRETSWYGIAQRLGDIHMHAVASYPKPYREYDCGDGMRLLVDKEIVGIGKFAVETLPPDAYSFVNDQMKVYVGN